MRVRGRAGLQLLSAVLAAFAAEEGARSGQGVGAAGVMGLADVEVQNLNSQLRLRRRARHFRARHCCLAPPLLPRALHRRDEQTRHRILIA